jgi:hypothetical protein
MSMQSNALLRPYLDMFLDVFLRDLSPRGAFMRKIFTSGFLRTRVRPDHRKQGKRNQRHSLAAVAEIEFPHNLSFV